MVYCSALIGHSVAANGLGFVDHAADNALPAPFADFRAVIDTQPVGKILANIPAVFRSTIRIGSVLLEAREPSRRHHLMSPYGLEADNRPITAGMGW